MILTPPSAILTQLASTAVVSGGSIDVPWVRIVIVFMLCVGLAFAAVGFVRLRYGMPFIPALIVSTTSFIRIVIVLAMVRHAFGMPQTPPNVVLVSLALFMSAFLMGPTLDRVNDEALSPFLDGSATVEQSLESAADPMREFMLRHTRESDIEMVYSISRTPLPETAEDIDILKLIPAFVMNELRAAFTIGFVIMLPFLLIDLVVASILLSLGMMMVPPQTISLPIKVLMFVLIDGWSLVMQGLIGSFT